MTTSDPIADMLARVRNAIMVGHSHVVMPSSKMKAEIARVLKDEGYIRNYEVIHEGPRATLRVWLKYSEDKEPVITGLTRISKPGRREYRGRRDVPWVRSGLGIAILSTPLGVMTDQQARRSRVGGEVLCQVW